MKIGIIEGTGFENFSVSEHTDEIELNTKYGYPSSSIKVAKTKGLEALLISKRSSSYTITPTNVNNRANITVLKELGYTEIIATTA